MPTWHLVNADPIAAANPYTFYKPAREVIRRTVPGEVVRLIFQFTGEDPDAPNAERMWVLVDEVGPDDSFKGRLKNQPEYITDLKLDDPIEFNACHVINTEYDDNDLLVERYIKLCLVTNRILYEGCRVGYLYREQPLGAKDSGWRITSNDESKAYMDDSKNAAFVSLGAVLNVDDSFRDLLDAPVGSAFIRNTRTGQFEHDAD